MKTSDSPNCARCGAPIPDTAAEHLCPACLMSGALGASANRTLSMGPGPQATRIEPPEYPFEFGAYRLLGLLGRGGMATVYEAEHIATGRRVALKMLSQPIDSPDMRQRFLREGRMAASVNHQNSLYVFGAEEIESWPAITMEIAGSGTLKDKLKKRGPLPIKEAVDAILDVISGLEAAHRGGVLHRDVKPSNCFVGPDGSVKVGDFGLSVSTLAKDDSYVTASGIVMGTPAYAAPEQLLGDDLDLRADIYSVGATLFTLITGKAPFDGENAVQVVVNAVRQKPTSLSELREDVPPGLERVVALCLAKKPEGRYADYPALRNALLPFGSKESAPASMKLRSSTGWIDFLIAFLVPYVILGLIVGKEEFHLGFIMERTLFSARYYIAFLTFGFLYFGIAEGIWGAGLGKRLKGLGVVRSNGQPPGIGRALIRILVPILSCEVVRILTLMATIKSTQINDMTTLEVVIFSVATSLCPLIPIAMIFGARRDNGFATVWDKLSGTRVVVRPKGTARPTIEPLAQPEITAETGASFGPYTLIEERVPGNWIVASDPVLRRQVWLLRRNSSAPSLARRGVARPGRPRWLQKVETGDLLWDAYEAPRGAPLGRLIEDGRSVPWGTLRLWLHDLASELWAATADETMPTELSLDHVWITAGGQAVLLDEPWQDASARAERIAVGDVGGQQRFLGAVAACVDSTQLPLHARSVLRNIDGSKFEKMSFLTGALRGILDRPAEPNRGVRSGSIFMLPLYVGLMLFVGIASGAEWLYEIIGDSIQRLAMVSALSVLIGCAVVQLLELPFRTTMGQLLFRLAVVDAKGDPPGMQRMLVRWAIVWLPLLLPLSLAALLAGGAKGLVSLSAIGLILLWIGLAIHAALHPDRGFHDRLADTWVVRR